MSVPACPRDGPLFEKEIKMVKKLEKPTLEDLKIGPAMFYDEESDYMLITYPDGTNEFLMSRDIEFKKGGFLDYEMHEDAIKYPQYQFVSFL